MRLTRAEAAALGVPEAKAKRTGFMKQQNGQDKVKERAKRLLYEGDKVFNTMCRAHGLPIPVPEYQFALPERKWAFDFLFDGWLAVEKVGGVWVKGHHSGGQNQIDDMEKMNEAQIRGYVVLQFTPQQFDSGEVFPIIRRALGELDERP